MIGSRSKSLTWNPKDTQAFQWLKEAFCTAPTLCLPDSDLPFIVEVDAYTTGVGAVLSQQQGVPQCLHPCAFSRKLSPVERNCDIGNRELLAIKLALQQWRHWLEGVKHPFLVLTDHCNLEYLKEAKRLNSRQAQWALFFTRFNFLVSYRPRSKIERADALSRQYSCDPDTRSPELILPPAVFVNPILWTSVSQPSAPLTESFRCLPI